MRERTKACHEQRKSRRQWVSARRRRIAVRRRQIIVCAVVMYLAVLGEALCDQRPFQILIEGYVSQKRSTLPPNWFEIFPDWRPR